LSSSALYFILKGLELLCLPFQNVDHSDTPLPLRAAFGAFQSKAGVQARQDRCAVGTGSIPFLSPTTSCDPGFHAVSGFRTNLTQFVRVRTESDTRGGGKSRTGPPENGDLKSKSALFSTAMMTLVTPVGNLKEWPPECEQIL
jgi:hypothetical protein